jgi:glycosyltransferase involved in cell wall biosynthesis
MRIAFDARGINWYNGTGIGTYTENILKNLININKKDFFHIYWNGGGYENYRRDNTDVVMTSKKHHGFFEEIYFPENLEKENIDIFHIPQNGIGYMNKIKNNVIVTIHDLIPYVMPETVGKGYLQRFLRELPAVVENSQGILTVSECSKNDIIKFFSVDENKVFVTPLAADAKYHPLDKEKCRQNIKNNYNIPGAFVLYLGGFSPRKNVVSLIKAFTEIYDRLDKEYSLVLIGAGKDQECFLKEFSDRQKIRSRIIFTGFVKENELPVFYNAAECFVYPSLYEGFGLPTLEAMSCGTPVIASGVSSIPEVVDGGGLLFNPQDEKNLTQTLLNLLSDEALKKELSLKAVSQSAKFSWEITSFKTLEAYEKTIK